MIQVQSRNHISLLHVSFLLVALFFSTWNYAADERVENTWHLIRESAGIQVFQQAKPDTKLKITQGTIELDAAFSTVLAVLHDVAACPKWVHDCKMARMVQNISLRESLHYSNFDAPLLFKDRDMYIHSKLQYSAENNSYQIALIALPEFAEPLQKRVRVKQMQAIWTLRVIDKEKTEIKYQLFLDPKIPLARQVNADLAKSVYHTLFGLRKMVRLPQYINHSFTAEELEQIKQE